MKVVPVFRYVALALAMMSNVGVVTAFDIGPGLAQQAWGMYKDMLYTSPILTKSLTSSGMMTVSDAICQKIMMKKDDPLEPPKKLDWSRMLQVAITGLTWSGPVQHWWFGTLDKMVNISDPYLRLFVKLFFDAIIFSPLTIFGYFTWRSVLEGSGIKGAKDKLSTRFTSTVIGAWKFWPFVNVINFSLVPLQFRVLYSNVLSLFWTGYLTYVNSKKITKKEPEPPAAEPATA